MDSDRSLRNFSEFLTYCAKKHGDATAVSMFREGSWKTLTYPELLERSHAISLELRAAGLNAGEIVGILSETSLDWVTHFFAILLAGGIASPMDPKLTRSELGAILQHGNPKFLLVSSTYREVGREIRHMGEHPAKLWVMDDRSFPALPESARAREEFPPIERSSSDTAVICYTSGTSARPKGVMLSIDALLFEAEALSKSEAQSSQKEVCLTILPLNHLYGLTGGLIYCLYHGTELCFAHELNMTAIQRCLKERGATRMLALPLFVRILFRGIQQKLIETQSPSRAKFINAVANSRGLSRIRVFQSQIFQKIRENFGNLNLIICGGSALDPEAETFFHGIGIPVYVGYGLTETGPVATVNTVGNNRARSVGRPLPGVDVRIVEEEIQIRGRNVMQGYYKDPVLTSEAITSDGWFRTGDLGKIDAQGYVFILGRKKSMIVLESGKKVYSEEVEGAISRSTWVKDVCVVGFSPTARSSETVTAVIHPSPEALKEFSDRPKELEKKVRQDIDRYLKELAAYKWPTIIIIRETPFMMTPSMKIKRHTLLAELERARA